MRKHWFKGLWALTLVVAVICLVGGCAKEAEARRYRDPCDTALASIMNTCADQAEETREAFDYGAYLHLILYEDADLNWEIGLWNTYENERDEFTSLIGAKIYLNRLFWQKKEE